MGLEETGVTSNWQWRGRASPSRMPELGAARLRREQPTGRAVAGTDLQGGWTRDGLDDHHEVAPSPPSTLPWPNGLATRLCDASTPPETTMPPDIRAPPGCGKHPIMPQ